MPSGAVAAAGHEALKPPSMASVDPGRRSAGNSRSAPGARRPALVASRRGGGCEQLVGDGLVVEGGGRPPLDEDRIDSVVGLAELTNVHRRILPGVLLPFSG